MKILEQNQVSQLERRSIWIHRRVQTRTWEAPVCVFSEKLVNEDQVKEMVSQGRLCRKPIGDLVGNEGSAINQLKWSQSNGLVRSRPDVH